MKLPFPIRGTTEWDDREYQRYLLNPETCLSFGPLPAKKGGYQMLERKIAEYVAYYEEPEDDYNVAN